MLVHHMISFGQATSLIRFGNIFYTEIINWESVRSTKFRTHGCHWKSLLSHDVTGRIIIFYVIG